MANDETAVRIRKFFSELLESDLPTEDQIKLLDTIVKETEELKLETEKYAEAHGLSYQEALKIVCQTKNWQKNDPKPNAVEAP